LLPPQPGYQQLREALIKYRHIETQGGWPTIDPDPPFRKRQRDPRLNAIRHRLRMEGDLPPIPSSDDDLYDDRLSPAIRRFQQRHGLKQNGLLNGPTRHLFTISLPSRIEQIQLNMERWRWLPRKFEERYLIVNIASFRLSMIENNKSVINMRVVVGKPYRRTPIFSAEMDHLVLNPYWYIPTKIAIEDKLPLIRRNPNYLKQQHIDVFLRLKSGFRPIDPSTINWEEVTPANFNYLLRQSPGPLNPLGRLKFIFPNRFDVYLHDTPSRHLFGQTSRDFSSGCIRLEKPVELAQYLLRDDPKWNSQRLFDTIQQGQERVIPLEHPVPVYLLYWTAWGTQDGRVHFREDLYGRDAVLMNSL
jgi:murein L,D-transpeptidase YcbB/YkuD